MKKAFVVLFVFFSIAGFSQSSNLKFSPFEKGEQAEFESSKKQIIKLFVVQDSLHGIFLRNFLIRNGVDLSRLSQHPDSLKIKPEGIEYILKPIKK